MLCHRYTDNDYLRKGLIQWATQCKWTSWYLIYPPWRDGRLSWPRWLAIPRWSTCPQMVTHPSTNRAQCRATTLIETKALLLSNATTHVLVVTLQTCCGRERVKIRGQNIPWRIGDAPASAKAWTQHHNSMACGSAVWSYLHCAIVRIQQQFRQSNNLRSAIPSVGAVDEHRLVIFVNSVDDEQRRFQQTRDVLQPLSVLHTDQPPDTQASKMINVDTHTKIKPIKSTWDFSFIWLILTTPNNNYNEEQHKKPNNQTTTTSIRTN